MGYNKDRLLVVGGAGYTGRGSYRYIKEEKCRLFSLR